MLQVNIDSAVRTVFGKGPMRRLRMENKTPANVYSGGQEPVALQFDTKMLFKNLVNLQGRNAVLTLDIEGDQKGKRHVLVQEVQKEPVSGGVVHIDFLEIDLEKQAEFSVPIEYVGTAKGVELGGVFKVFKNDVSLRGCPLDIPDVVKVDITNLEQGGSGIKYGDLQLPEKVEMLEKPDVTCVIVY